MRIFLALLLATTGAISHASSQFEGVEHAYAVILTDSAPLGIKAIAKTVSGRSNSVALTDLVAERLTQSCKGQQRLDSDTTAWLAKALGSTGNPRYQNIMSNCLDLTQDKKLARHLSAALDKLYGEKGAPYEPQQLAFKQLNKTLHKNRNKQKKRPTAANISNGILMEEVYRRFGAADALHVVSNLNEYSGARTSSWSPIWSHFKEGARRTRANSARIMANYGELSIQLAQLAHGQWTVETFQAPQAGDENLTPAQRQQVASIRGTDPLALRATIQQLFKAKDYDPVLLDEIGKRMRSQGHSNDAYFIDAFSWACKLFGASKNGRYRTVVSEVEQAASHKKLKKYARAALKKLPKKNIGAQL